LPVAVLRDRFAYNEPGLIEEADAGDDYGAEPTQHAAEW